MALRDKIRNRNELASLCEQFRREGKVVGFTSGAFDLLHAGHADYLEKARERCDILCVGVNTDASVRQYKGENRPIVPEAQRAELLAALEAVDYVFLFSERRNAANIEALKPDLYIKAGDYEKSGLTSAELVEKHGGQALLIPVTHAVSTTAILDKIRREGAGAEGLSVHPGETPAVALPGPPRKTAPAAFLDRDGVINEEVGYLHDPEQFQLVPGAGEGLRQLQDMGYRLVVVTNQCGIGLGYFSKEDFFRVNSAMFKALKPYGVALDRIYYCPHGYSEKCQCRKPQTAMMEQAVKDLNIDLNHSALIGDRTSDMEAARRLGIQGILLRTGAAGGDGQFDMAEAVVLDNLPAAARWLLERERANREPG